jgi:hypothetical protein
MNSRHKIRQAISIQSLRLPEIESIARDDERLKPRRRAPGLAGLRIEKYIEELAKEIIRNERVGSRSWLAEAARVFQELQSRCGDDEEEKESLRSLRALHVKTHQAWRRKEIDDITMSALADRFEKTRTRHDFIDSADFLRALRMRVDIDLSVAAWNQSECEP